MKKNVLFVDDEKALRDATRRLLRAKRGEWNMVFAESVDDALSRMEEMDTDAVISDINMPKRDGFDLLQAIRSHAEWFAIPVVILTGNADAGLKSKALEYGATDLLNKPVSREDLVARIGSVLKIKEYQDEISRQNEQLEQRVLERTAQLEASQAELVWRLGRAGEFRDSETGYHVVRVGFLARAIARELGMDADFRRHIFLTAPLHDLGKIGIPDAILLKPASLTEEEWVTMRSHARIGADILRDQSFLGERLGGLGEDPLFASVDRANPFTEMAARIAEGHHERWDGAGYPDGISGEAIPIEARITTIADVYDALGSRRPYKEPFTEEEVLRIMTHGVGTQFDPAVFDAFRSSLPELREIRIEFSDGGPEDPQADVAESIQELRRAS